MEPLTRGNWYAYHRVMPTTHHDRQRMTRADLIVTILVILALAAMWLGLIYLWFVPR